MESSPGILPGIPNSCPPGLLAMLTQVAQSSFQAGWAACAEHMTHVPSESASHISPRIGSLSTIPQERPITSQPNVVMRPAPISAAHTQFATSNTPTFATPPSGTIQNFKDAQPKTTNSDLPGTHANNCFATQNHTFELPASQGIQTFSQKSRTASEGYGAKSIHYLPISSRVLALTPKSFPINAAPSEQFGTEVNVSSSVSKPGRSDVSVKLCRPEFSDHLASKASETRSVKNVSLLHTQSTEFRDTHTEPINTASGTKRNDQAGSYSQMTTQEHGSSKAPQCSEPVQTGKMVHNFDSLNVS